MSENELLANYTYEDFLKYNQYYKSHTNEFKYTCAVPYNLFNADIWVRIRKQLQYTDDLKVGGNWYELPITEYRVKYGTDTIYINVDKKLWRTHKTDSEFYHNANNKRFLEDYLWNKNIIDKEVKI